MPTGRPRGGDLKAVMLMPLAQYSFSACFHQDCPSYSENPSHKEFVIEMKGLT